MITETHQCPCCGALLSAAEIDLQACKACGACYLPKKVKNITLTKPLPHGLRQLEKVLNRTDLHLLRGFNGGFGQFL